jgi:GAF domain-containing protein
MPPNSPELDQLQDIAGAFYASKMTRDEARSAVIDVILTRLQCSRISLWRFDGDARDLRLLRFAAKVAGQPLDTTPGELRESEYGDYFDELVGNGVYVSVDVKSDPVMRPMREAHLDALDVRSLLDAAFMLNGRAYGMVCCEQIGTIRRWRTDEVIALRTMVAKLALLMATGADQALWSAPSLPMEPLKLTA